MATPPKSSPPDLDFEQIEMLANFNEYAADYPEVSFQEIAKKLGVDFSVEVLCRYVRLTTCDKRTLKCAITHVWRNEFLRSYI